MKSHTIAFNTHKKVIHQMSKWKSKKCITVESSVKSVQLQLLVNDNCTTMFDSIVVLNLMQRNNNAFYYIFLILVYR